FHVTGVQTCALPIFPVENLAVVPERSDGWCPVENLAAAPDCAVGRCPAGNHPPLAVAEPPGWTTGARQLPGCPACRSSHHPPPRSEERRVGEERRCR